jgi:hypothetical protein
VAHLAGLGPFGELDFGDELGLDPGGSAEIGTFSATGFLSVISGTSSACTARSVSASKPVPARPAYFQPLPSRTAKSSAPKYLRLRRGAVKPTITTSCSWLALTFSQSRVRSPEW